MAQRLIPGVGFVETTGVAGQYLVPGIGFVEVESAGGGGSTYTITIDAGSYNLTGELITLQKNLSLDLSSGIYTITGQDLTLLTEGSYRLILDSGVYNITGITPNIGIGTLLESGTYSVTGNSVRLVSSTEPVLVQAGPTTISISIKIGM